MSQSRLQLDRLISIALLCTAATSQSASAQNPAGPPSGSTADRKSEGVAVLLEALVPVLGHAYAGDARRGVVPLVVSAGGIALMIVGVASATSDPFDNASSGVALVGMGALAYTAGRIWGMVSAYQTAVDYNRGPSPQVALRLTATRHGVGPAVMVSF
jgi:hypothetical protein